MSNSTLCGAKNMWARPSRFMINGRDFREEGQADSASNRDIATAADRSGGCDYNGTTLEAQAKDRGSPNYDRYRTPQPVTNFNNGQQFNACLQSCADHNGYTIIHPEMCKVRRRLTALTSEHLYLAQNLCFSTIQNNNDAPATHVFDVAVIDRVR